MNAISDPSVTATRSQCRTRALLDRLSASPLYRKYCDSFQSLTGLPLELDPVSDGFSDSCRCGGNQNSFCQILNREGGGFSKCMAARKHLAESADGCVRSVSCFAGLRETAVPLMLGQTTIAHLKTGQILHEKPDAGTWAQVKKELGEIGGLVEIEKAFSETALVPKDRYQSMVTLLASFSLLLGRLLKQIASEMDEAEQSGISHILDYLEDHFSEPLELDALAARMGVSTYHFCRKFKEVAGETLTQHITRLRVDRACEALRESDWKITDIAYEVGFQSLSQFNRSFHRITGRNPSNYRRAS